MQFKNRKFKLIFNIVVYAFAIIGFVFFGVFIAMRLHLTNVSGSIDSRNQFFNNLEKNISGIKNDSSSKMNSVLNCKIMTISSFLPENGKIILDNYAVTKSPIIAEKMVQAVVLVTKDNKFLQDKINKCDNEIGKNYNFVLSNNSVFDWIVSSEWQTLREALVKDEIIIKKASEVSGVPARIIISSVISEQFRFFTSNRDAYKRYFEPLKLLGNGTKFSYGVAGVKFETAKAIEENLKNKNSPFYLGPEYENIFDYGSLDHDTELLRRLSDNKDHYYSYLYTAIFLKQIMHHWEQAGYDISDRPEVLATLFNLGFYKSSPKPNPEVGGSTITINNRDYTFGGLSFEFYYSGELGEIFPLEV